MIIDLQNRRHITGTKLVFLTYRGQGDIRMGRLEKDNVERTLWSCAAAADPAGS